MSHRRRDSSCFLAFFAAIMLVVETLVPAAALATVPAISSDEPVLATALDHEESRSNSSTAASALQSPMPTSEPTTAPDTPTMDFQPPDDADDWT